ncbi:hypothetical protein TNCV_2390781 [Trichonephila clavipes]|nr:hypothetical protein TNCV_2390781 [Trichonephila clavipes]
MSELVACQEEIITSPIDSSSSNAKGANRSSETRARNKLKPTLGIMRVNERNSNVTIQSNARSIGNGPHLFETRSSNEDDI